MKGLFLLLLLIPVVSSYLGTTQVQAGLVKMFLAETRGKNLTEADLQKLKEFWTTAVDIALNKSLSREEVTKKMEKIYYENLSAADNASSVPPRYYVPSRAFDMISKLQNFDKDARYFGVDGRELLEEMMPYAFGGNFTTDTGNQRAQRVDDIVYKAKLIPGGEKLREIWGVIMPSHGPPHKEEEPGDYSADTFHVVTDGMRIVALPGLTFTERVHKLVTRITRKNLWADLWKMGYNKYEFGERFIREFSPVKTNFVVTDKEFDKMTPTEKLRLVNKIINEGEFEQVIVSDL